jgi:hypothetical protein
MSTYPFSKSTASVRYAGSRNPADTVEINRRAHASGVIDLVGGESAANDDNSRKTKADKFSTTLGKRKKAKHVTTNLSNYCTTLEENWSQGAFRWVHMATYTPDPRIPGDTGGPQNGELCVLKEFKTGSVYEDSFFDNDIKAVDKAEEIISAFNSYCNRIITRPGSKKILLNKPAV